MRIAAGHSQESLASQAGITKQTVWLIESGRVRQPHRHTADSIAQALGVAADEFYDEAVA